MKLIVGLGNPEKQYHGTRHNSGFFVLDWHAKRRGLTFQKKAKFKADIAEETIDNTKVIYAKPTTYYNLSGETVRTIANFYSIQPKDILIVHDDLMLPFGTIRTRRGGSDAGNNGLKSIAEHVGQDTARLRIGIANDLRSRIDDADFVLAHFSKDEQETLTALQAKISELIDSFISDTFTAFTHR